ncbi:phage head-tail adaptor [Solidesulfovibrio carbinoliphilus subsp. oakridgensis]|uniref:Phage head-tail adaptor n=1 Tax=Solidesulfovibrio carbinoliphilus subsp. oakridgensis TaxID=694327 RepID=G7QC50_9BACT|nr:phage head closure protein [Solidesulfovibrio carbinoliphilus]EHJ49496.1 phage head-tail adaptor [Solidesulfovibrio carbinoliphilus subsp. oakridgensis]
MGIRAGELKHRLTIEANTPVRDEYGGMVPGWAPVAKVWAKLWAKSGQERQTARANQAEVSHGVLMRSFAGLTTAHRLTMGTRSFAITFINDTIPGQFTLDVTEKLGREAS